MGYDPLKLKLRAAKKTVRQCLREMACHLKPDELPFRFKTKRKLSSEMDAAIISSDDEDESPQGSQTTPKQTRDAITYIDSASQMTPPKRICSAPSTPQPQSEIICLDDGRHMTPIKEHSKQIQTEIISLDTATQMTPVKDEQVSMTPIKDHSKQSQTEIISVDTATQMTPVKDEQLSCTRVHTVGSQTTGMILMHVAATQTCMPGSSVSTQTPSITCRITSNTTTQRGAANNVEESPTATPSQCNEVVSSSQIPTTSSTPDISPNITLQQPKPDTIQSPEVCSTSQDEDTCSTIETPWNEAWFLDDLTDEAIRTVSTITS